MARKSEIRQFYLFEALGKNSQLGKEGGAGQGKGVRDLPGAELVEKADAVPFAAAEDGLHFFPSEAFGR